MPHYSIVDLEEKSQALASVLIYRLPKLLSPQIPNNRMYLLPWVWYSLKRNLTTIAMMMIVSKYTIEYKEMIYRKQHETLITGREHVTTANITL